MMTLIENLSVLGVVGWMSHRFGVSGCVQGGCGTHDIRFGCLSIKCHQLKESYQSTIDNRVGLSIIVDSW
jgi:hypothetical protein